MIFNIDMEDEKDQTHNIPNYRSISPVNINVTSEIKY